jgi:hypothetical protein
MGRRLAGRLTRVLVCLAVAGSALTVAAQAIAADPFVWAPAQKIDVDSLGGLSCPSATLCVAVDNQGTALSTRDPGGGGPWKESLVDAANSMSNVSCPSVSLCVAIDDAGDVVISTRPTGGASAWQVHHVDSGSDPSMAGVLLQGLSCHATRLCVATDAAGNVVSTADPSGPGPWTVTHVDDGITYQCYHYGGTGPDCQPALESVSCPSVSLCVAVDNAGNVITSHDPTGGAAAWTGASTNSSIPMSEAFTGVSCPSVSLCVAAGANGQVVTWNPTSSRFKPTSAAVDPTSGLFGVWCHSVSLCFAGDLYVTTRPAGAASSWRRAEIGFSDASDVSCPSASMCLVVEGNGKVIVGTTVTRLKADLLEQLAPVGSAARIATLVKQGGYSSSFRAPTPGRIAISWFLIPRGARLAGDRPAPVLVAAAVKSFVKHRVQAVRIRLTADGKRLLRGARHVRLTAKGTLTTVRGTAITTARTFTLNR